MEPDRAKEVPNDLLAGLARRAEAGDADARDALFAALYSELHRLAESHLRRSPGNVTLSATTLLHEAYVDIASRSALAFPDRNRFLQYASRAMRGLVIEYMRRRGARKRGGELTFTTLDEERMQSSAAAPDVESLGTALETLTEMDAPLAELVDLRFFCGFSMAEIAAIRGVSERSVQRDWTKARLLLRRFIEGQELDLDA
jgi:RNA polymerase sigma factor (TIGR02999 family)